MSRAPRTSRPTGPILRALLTATSEAVLAVDAFGRVTLANERAEALLGCAASEAVGRSASDLALPDHLADLLRRGERAVATGDASTGETPIVGPEGVRAVLRYTIVPIGRDGRRRGALIVADRLAPQGAAGSAVDAEGPGEQFADRERQSMRELLSAHEEERRAVAYDLHDGLTQYVMAAHAHLQAFSEVHGTDSRDRAARELDLALRYLREAVSESRRLVSGMASLPLHEQGLASALEHLLAREGADAGWDEALLDHDLAGVRFDAAVETALYRVAQEALTNARKHAHAGRVRVTLAYRQDGPAGVLTLEVRDWGAGFAARARPAHPGHVGLRGMVQRIALLGGECRVTSTPGLGTTVAAAVPGVVPAALEGEQPDA